MPTLLVEAVLVAAFVHLPAARAAEVLDQTTGTTSYLAHGLAGWKYMAQSFVPGAGHGQAVRAELWLERDGTPPSNLSFHLRSGTSSDNIVSATIDPSTIADVSVGQWYSITLSLPQGTSLNPGSTYWLVLYADGYTLGNDVAWFYAENDYAGGSSYTTKFFGSSWPPPGNWTALKEGDLAFRVYADDGWSDVDTTTTVSAAPDPITPPTSTTVTVAVKDANNANVPAGPVLLSVSPKEGTFAGGGSGPVTLTVVNGQASITWTPPVVTGSAKTYTFTAAYGPYGENASKKNYKKSTGTDTLTVNPLHAPSIVSITPGIDDRAGNDIGIFIGGLSGWVAVNNTFTAAVSDQEGAGDINKVEFFIDDVLKATDAAAPYEFTYDMSTLGTGNATLRVRATDQQGLIAEQTRTILTIAPPPWLFAGASYVLNPQVTWEGAAHVYRFTGKIPNNPALFMEQQVS
ncbi:MAG: Ig-like domain-containing protein, partial [Planctomycetes bacterium]|nr:Ig-like domain-containing protein [Planctomycetota bacterium]